MSPNTKTHNSFWPKLSNHDCKLLQRISHYLQSLIDEFSALDHQMKCSGLLVTAHLRSLGVTDSHLARDISAMSRYLNTMRFGVLESLEKDLVAVNFLLDHHVEGMETMATEEALSGDTLVVSEEGTEARHGDVVINTKVRCWLRDYYGVDAAASK